MNTKFSSRKTLSAAISLAIVSGSCAVAAQEDGTLEEVMVTGSYIKSSPDDAAVPVQVVGREYIDSIGATTVADVMARLPLISGSENQADSFTQGSTQGTSNVNLRGLGLSSTLVLINGRRQTISGALSNDGSVFVDTSTIPVDAIERVEVLKEGAASAYGSDAVAGVVNFILRSDFEGVEINGGVRRTGDGGQQDTNFGMVWGGGDEDTRFTLSAHYLDRTPLSGADRPELVDNAISSLGNSFLPYAAAPVNVASGAYAGTYMPFESVPDAGCTDNKEGVLIPQPSGVRCGFHYGEYYNLVNTENRAQVYGNLTQEFSGGIELFAEIGYSSSEVTDNPQSPSYPDLTFPVIDASHPGNPFGVPVIWLGRPLGAGFEPPTAARENDTLRTSLQLTGETAGGLSWDSALTYSANQYTQFQQDTLKSRLLAGLAGMGGPNNDEWFNPFTPTSNSQGLIDDFSYVTEATRETDLLIWDAVISGDLMELPAGTLSFAAGVQARSEGFSVDTDDVYELKKDANGNPIPVDLIFLGGLSHVDESRNGTAVFTEVKAPLTDTLELTGALRYENLDTDSSFDPKLAARWQISDQWILRASASTAFRQPSLSQQYATAVTLNGIQDFNADGTTKGGVAFIRVAASGSDELKPEESENYNIGVIFQPTDDLDFKLDYWRVDYTNLITVENAQGKLLANLDGPDIQRDQFGNLSGINVEYFNSSSVDVAGLDFESIWQVNDQWSTALNIAHFLSYEITNEAGNTVEAAGYFNYDNFARSMPKTKANLAINWMSDRQTAGLNINYISSYDMRQAVPDTEQAGVDSVVTLDTQYSRSFAFGMTEDAETTLSIGIQNLLDEAPPRAYNGANLSYDPKQHNPLGRVFYARAKYSF
ncbi:TonB-dependent siderophore receptor [Microbulbifer sp. HZ11]|uniref:TonB-dependent receptor plug domain-containing protein n=1 Tax=Microbulbifer sp. HZ11 TaxID=1453501 RepID=UPI0005B8BCCF|nr:TonB-dependent receptor [Microbulbifer sp. HZ11]